MARFQSGIGYNKEKDKDVKPQVLLEEVMEKLRKRKISVLVAIDEVTATDAMSESYKKAFKEGGRYGSQDIFDKMAKMTCGYAYAFQLLGYYIWETGEKEITLATLKSVLEKYKTDLYANSYTKIMQEMSSVDREFLYAMADSKTTSISISTVGERMNKPKNYISRYRQRLLEGHIISATDRGIITFSLSYFGEFTKRYRELYE